MLAVLTDVLLPVLIVAGLGAIARRRLQISVESMDGLVFHVLGPSLIFTSLVRVDFADSEPARIAAFVAILISSMLAVAWVLSRLAHMEIRLARAFLLVTAFPNMGNYGISVAMLAFGDAGVSVAIVLFTAQTVLAQLGATFIAASHSRPARAAIAEILRLPATIAIAAAMAVAVVAVPVPGPLLVALQLPAQAAIPAMLLVLGMHLSGVRLSGYRGTLTVAVALRLVVGLAIGFVLVELLQFEGLTRAVLIVSAGMPTAVYTTVIAARYDAQPAFVADAVLLSTLASIATTGLALTLLGALS